MKRLIVFASLLALAACGGGHPSSGQDLNGDGIDDPVNPLVPDSITQVAPSSPKGKVSGRVLTMKGTPISDAEVTVSGPSAGKATTDASGLFQVDNITGGSVVGVFVTKAGYAPAWTTTVVPAAAGNFPLNDGVAFVGDIALLPTTGSVTFNVIGYDGKPITGTATLDVTPGFVVNATGKNVGAGDIMVTGEIKDGVLTFTGVPAIEDAAWMTTADVPVKYTVYVNPVVADAATGVGYGGTIMTLAAAKLLTEPWSRTLVLPPATDTADLAIVATNVHNLMKAPSPASENLIAKAGTIYVAFNQPVGADIFVEIRNDDPDIKDSAVIGINNPKDSMNTLGTELKIIPKTPGFVDGQKYNLIIQVSSRDNPAGGIKTFSAPFFGGDPAAPKSLGTPTINLNEQVASNDTWDLTESLEIVFDKYIGRGDAIPPTIPIYFDNDLNNNTDVGDVRGELGSNQPICVTGAEEVPGFFPAKASGYAKKFNITPALMAGSYTSTLQATEISITLAFNESFKCAGGSVHTVWGEALSAKTDGLQVTVVPPP